MKRKRMLTLLLALMMFFSVFPASVFAESEMTEDAEIVTLEDWADAAEVPSDDAEAENDEDALPWEEESAAMFDGEAEPAASEDETAWDDADNDVSDPFEDDLPEDTSADESEEQDAAMENEQEEMVSSDEETEQEIPVEEMPPVSNNPLKDAIDLNGHAYVMTNGETAVYDTHARDHGPFFVIAQKNAILLATAYHDQNDRESVKVWFLSNEKEILAGYVSPRFLHDTILTDEEIHDLADMLWSDRIYSDAGVMYAFVLDGYSLAQEDTEEEFHEENAADEPDFAFDPDEGAAVEEMENEAVFDESQQEIGPDEQDEGEETAAENEPDASDPEVSVGTFLSVTTETRVFSDADDTLRDEYNGDLYMGVFVKDAVVQVDAIELDSVWREWYRVRFLYGDDFADGTMKWTEIGLAYVLPEETALTDAEEVTVTDIALPSAVHASGRRKAKAATAMNGFTLKSINAPIAPLYAGQTGVYGSSGKDSDYKQIASTSGKGVVYATPHYLDGYTVYCLEHNLPGPGEGSGSSQQPKGPYVIVDIDSYMNTPGNSKLIYSESTMHAIAWVLRHTYPVMALDRSDSDNETWSRVAGQFAIRQVIRELEGSQYVRDYWNMDNFYVASGQAPAVYLEYARWLATNGIARGQITGALSVTNKSVAQVNGQYVGTATISTDADLIRISKSAGTITGNTGGSDASYYYLNSGDTIQIISSTNGFSVTAESVNSDAEEASFLVGVPSAAIQKVLIPQQGHPYKMQFTSLYFEQVIQYGNLTVTKLRDRGSQQALAGAKIQLYDSNNKEYGSPVTTDANGEAKWTNLPYGTYYVGEISAPIAYQIDMNRYQVTINGDHAFTIKDSPIIGSVRFVKRQKDTDIPLVGAQYELLMKSGTNYVRAVSAVDGKELPVLSTDKDGIATWSNVVEYGDYFVHEVKAPEGFLLDDTYYSISVKEQSKIVVADVEDPIITTKIKIAKTDSLTKEPLEGVEFTITRLSGPDALNGAGVGEVAAVIITDASGHAETDWLAWGRFLVEETKVPNGYTDGHFSTEIEAYEDGKTYTVNVENVPAAGYIRLTKTDANSKKPLKGVQFDIYQGDKLISTMTTNADGVALSDALIKGRYTVKEHQNPEGYTGELVTLPAEVISEKTTKLAAENTPIQGKIRITKKDALTKETMADVVFTVTRLSASPAADGANIGESFTLTTDENGVAESGWLDYGTFKIEETSVPEHYIDSHFTIEVEITEHEKTYTVDVENEPTQGKIQITKTDKLDGQPISGVVFDIYQEDQYISSMITDQSGMAVSDLLPKGPYSVKEKDNPQGYTGELISLDCEVFSDETTKLTADNTPIQFQVKIVKTDGLTKQPLAGAVFTITRISGLPSQNGAGDGKVVATLTTDAKGEAVSDLLTWGQYEITETTVPEHYVDNGFTTTVTGTENNKTYTVTCENEPTKGWIRLVKTDSLDNHPIAGIQFDIYQDGKIISTMTTDADGVAISEPLPKGRYTVKEHKNPIGYTAELVSLDCEVFSDQTTELKASNTPIQFWVKIEKTDQLTKEPLADAEFTITRKSGLPFHDGEDDGEVVAVLVTDNNGEAVSDLLTWGVYEVTESKVPVHFVDNHFITTITGSEDNKTYTISCENEPTKGYIKIVKTDKLDRTPIEGVQFDIYYNDQYGEGLAATMTTDKNGVAVSPALRKGKYVVKEHANPIGYISDLVELDAVVKSDETTNLSCTNTPIQGKIRIIKTDELTGEALAGAEFTITRISGLPSHKGSNDGEIVAVISTDADGIAISPLLTWGTYLIEETVVPEHFVDRHFSLEVAIDQEDMHIYEIQAGNEPTKGWIRLTKTDRQNGNPIVGVVFDVYYNDQYGDGLACTMMTDENGMALSEPIRKGRYTVRERGETPGYLFEEVTMDCTVKSDEITDLSATNQPVQVKLKLYKRDADEYTGNPADDPGTRGDGVLTGAVFQVLAGADILDRQGNTVYEKGAVVIERLTTAGDDASVTTDELWPGVYEIAELTPPIGYQPSEDHIFVDASGAAEQSAEAIITYDGVKTNEILYGKYGFVKFLGDNQIHDDAGLIETPEPGAEFQIYLKSAGSYDAARPFERDHITTDQYGKAETKLLPYGVYTVKQIKGKDGYAIKAPFDIFIRGTEDENNPPSIIINNEAIHYRLKFIKVDAETGKTIALANTAFKLKDANGEYITQTVHYPRMQVIDTFKTDADGTVTLPETVRYGLYFIEEFTAPEGYLIQTEELTVFVGDETMMQPGEAYLLEFTIPNEPVKGEIALEKKGLQLTGFVPMTDESGFEYQQPVYEEKYLAGAIFEVHAAEDIIGKDGTVWFQKDELVDTIVTTAAGRDESKVLPLGKYYLLETEAPDGFIFSDTRHETDLRYADDHTPLVEIMVTAKNDYLPVEISLEKEKEIMEVVHDRDGAITQIVGLASGEGFLFGLYNDQDIRYDGGTLMADTLIAVGQTDQDGKLTFSGCYPHGRYYIKELYAEDGWKINPNRFPISLLPSMQDSDHVIRVSLPAPVQDELIYTHITLTKTDITGQQAVPGALIEVADSDENVIYRSYTDENGEIPDIPVMPGNYVYREILAPEGYELNKTEMRFSVDKDGNVTGDTVIRDDYTRFYLLKLDENGRPLQGVEFGLMKDIGEPIFTAVSDENGIVMFEKIPYGTFSIVETKPLPGYIPNETSVQITVDGSFVNPTMPLATWMNQPNEVLVKKIDQDGHALPGAEFILCDEYGERVASAISDQEGMVRFSKIPYGEYTCREIKAPNGYLLNREVIHVTIDADYRNSDMPLATVVNHLKRLRFIKVDPAGNYLPDVEFSLINATMDEVVETVVSNENGEFVFSQFDYGVWIIRETKAPEGYSPMEDMILSVDSDWTEPEPFTCVNVPNHFEFIKVDHEGNPMAGVKFVLEDQGGNILRDLESGEDGIVHVDELAPGKYLVREIETWEGFTVSGETIEIVIDEHYTIPDEMFALVNYPNIQTGAGFTVTPTLWIGAGVALTGVAMSIAYAVKQKKRKRRGKRK